MLQEPVIRQSLPRLLNLAPTFWQPRLKNKKNQPNKKNKVAYPVMIA